MEKHHGKITINDKCTYCCKCVESCPESILNIKKTGFRLTVGGKEGSTVMFGKECAIFVDDFEAFEIIENVLHKYQKKVALRPGSSKKKERLGEVIERLGLEVFMS